MTTAAKTWLADNLNIEYEYRFEETENGKWISHIDAWLSNYDDSIHGEAVIWENISFHQGDCDQEPVDGLLWIREGEGRWVRLDFDDTCDGCGTIVGTKNNSALTLACGLIGKSFHGTTTKYSVG